MSFMTGVSSSPSPIAISVCSSGSRHKEDPYRCRRQCRAERRPHQSDPRQERPTPVPASSVYIERALINPSGADASLEIVVLASLSTAAQTLTNWRLVDKNGRVTPINVTIGPGQSVLIRLDGRGVQLGNQGGNVILQDDRNTQVDVVTYTAADANLDDRYVRFHFH